MSETKQPHADASAYEGLWRRYGVADGLPPGGFFAFAQDRHGRLWIGSGDGVCVGDGTTWRVYTRSDGLPDNIIWAIVFDGAGCLWAGTDKGICRFDGEAWSTFTTEDGLTSDSVRAVMIDRKGRVVAGAGSDLHRFDGRRWQPYPAWGETDHGQVMALMPDEYGRVWVGARGGLYCLDAETGRRIADAPAMPDRAIRGLFKDDTGGMYAGRPDGLWRLEKQEWHMVPEVGPQPVNAYLPNPEGGYWLASERGLFQCNDGVCHPFGDIGTDLGSPIVHALFRDRENLLWVGTQNGISCYDDAVARPADPDRVIVKDSALSLAEDARHRIWIGTYHSGLFSTDGTTWNRYTPDTGLPGNRVRALIPHPHGGIVVGTGRGAAYMDGDPALIPVGLDAAGDQRIYALARDDNRRLWIGAGEAVYRLGDGTTHRYTVEDDLPGGRLRALVVDRSNHVWAGGDNGICIFNGETWRTFGAEDGLRGGTVYCLAVMHDDTVWAGTAYGPFYFDGERWTTPDRLAFLSTVMVTSILPDTDGTIWFGTRGHGVVRFDGNIVRRLSIPDEDPDDTIYAMLRRANGEVWLGTGHGVIRRRRITPAPPVVLIDRVEGDGRQLSVVEEETIATSASSIRVAFYAVGFRTSPDRMHYVCRLLGQDTAWRNTRHGHSEYHDLPSGRYTFEVKACDPDFSWSVEPARIVIERYDPPEQLRRESFLDHLRRQVAGMRYSHDFHPLIATLRPECDNHGVTLSHFGFFVFDTPCRIVIITLTDESGRMLPTITSSYDEMDIFEAAAQSWGQDRIYSTEGDVGLFERWKHLTDSQDRGDLSKAFTVSEGAYLYFFPFPQGMLYTVVDQLLMEKDQDFLWRIAAAFGIAYARHMDFMLAESQKAKLETQNRQLADANDRLQELDRMKSEFLRHVTHDLKTPLTSAVQAVNNLRDFIYGPLNERQIDAANCIKRNAASLLALIDTLLDVAHLEAGATVLNRSRLDLLSVAARVVEEIEPLAAKRGIVVSLSSEWSTIEVYADNQRIYQVMANLIGNAVKYTNKGGRVDIHLSFDNRTVRFTVADTGVGIPEKDQPFIFDAFYQGERPTRKRLGSGLGLSIVRKLVGLHGGEIGFDSVSGKGSIFWFTLPGFDPRSKKR